MKNGFETLTGAVVIGAAAAFMFFAYERGKGGDMSSGESYAVTASFADIGTLGAGADVRISGIKIGYVESLTLAPETYRAETVLRVNSNIKLPDDSSAAIVSDGLLGGKYVSLEAGGADASLNDGDEIQFTQDAVSLEELIGKFAFGGGDDKKDEESESSSPF